MLEEKPDGFSCVNTTASLENTYARGLGSYAKLPRCG